jgi:hypothetical protein
LRGKPSKLAVVVICSIEEREFTPVLIEDSRGFIWPVDSPKLFASQPSPPFNNYWLTGQRDLISDIYIRVGVVGDCCSSERSGDPAATSERARSVCSVSDLSATSCSSGPEVNVRCCGIIRPLPN